MCTVFTLFDVNDAIFRVNVTIGKYVPAVRTVANNCNPPLCYCGGRKRCLVGVHLSESPDVGFSSQFVKAGLDMARCTG